MPVDFVYDDPAQGSPNQTRPDVATAPARYSDVRLFATVDGGEITWTGGNPELADGLETAVYLSLYGGNRDDGGGDADKPRQWWGNLALRNDNARLRSRTQKLLDGLPAVPANLNLVEQAVLADLAWMSPTYATDISARVTMPALNRASLEIRMTINGQIFQLTFLSSWGAKAA